MTMLTEEKLREFFWENEYIRSQLDNALREVLSGRTSPYQAAAAIVKSFKIDSCGGP
jgi:hypothetical protein